MRIVNLVLISGLAFGIACHTNQAKIRDGSVPDVSVDTKNTDSPVAPVDGRQVDARSGVVDATIFVGMDTSRVDVDRLPAFDVPPQVTDDAQLADSLLAVDASARDTSTEASAMDTQVASGDAREVARDQAMDVVLDAAVDFVVLPRFDANVDAPVPRLDANGENPPTFSLPLGPLRQLDLLFVLDNSASMQPKRDKLSAQFATMIETLRDPVDNSLPDLRVTILDSDVGTGASGTCTPQYGDRGLFQLRDSAKCGLPASEKWMEIKNGQPVNFTGTPATVFQCLANNLGYVGCGFEQPLMSLYLAFNEGTALSQRQFIRPDALLGVVLLTDEDDCSTPLNSLMTQANLSSTEAWSLRCSTRGHQCGGQPLAYPTTGPVSFPLAACSARMGDGCPDTETGEGPTTCNPLREVAWFAEGLRDLKGTTPEARDRLVMMGIYGMPRPEEAASAQYRIGKIPNPTPGQPDIYDRLPDCYDPDHPPSAAEADAGYSGTALGFGGWAGLRIKAFLDSFGTNGLHHSVCERSYVEAMKGVTAKLATKTTGPCLPTAYTTYAICDAKLVSTQGTVATLPRCDDPATTQPCYTLIDDPSCAGPQKALRLVGSSTPVGVSRVELYCR